MLINGFGVNEWHFRTQVVQKMFKNFKILKTNRYLPFQSKDHYKDCVLEYFALGNFQVNQAVSPFIVLSSSH